jgi:hypothetical protein
MQATMPSDWLRWGLANIFAQVDLELHPTNLSLPSSQDYRCEPLVPGSIFRIFKERVGPDDYVHSSYFFL